MMCCDDKHGCEHPDKKRQVEDCTPEQIEECHGEVETHTCDNTSIASG